MGFSLGILSILTWIDYFFPSLTVYTNTIGPFFVLIFGIVSIFSDILPKPGVLFYVPELEDINIELKSSGYIVIVLSKMARRLTIVVNTILLSKPYETFYKISKYFTGAISYIKMSRNKTIVNKVSPPKEFDSNFDNENK
jgi:hypothetical protein